MPAFGTATDLPELFRAIRARLLDRTAFAARQVLLTQKAAKELAEAPPDDTFVAVRLGRVVGIPSYVAGGLNGFTAAVGVQLWHRRDTDVFPADDDFLTACDAMLPTWLKVFGALQLFVPVRKTDATLALVIEPMRDNPGLAIADHPPQNWGRLDATFEMKFVHRTS